MAANTAALTDPTLGFFGPIPDPPTKEGPDGGMLRRRWALTGTKPKVHGNAQFEWAYVPDDGTPDGQVVHDWDEPDGLLPACLRVTGWTYWSCHEAYERLWRERNTGTPTVR